jgi:threonine/homoserine/homoserine lactone efflux protein
VGAICGLPRRDDDLPGPNVALIVANSIAHGPRYGLATVLGTSSAMVLQLGCTVVGLTGVLSLMAMWFGWLRWLGVAYLVYLGVNAWRAPAIDLSQTLAQPQSSRAMYLRGFLVSLTNPKTLLFYAAFLPQFVSPEHDQGSQLMLLAASFLVIAVLLDSSWALLAHRVARVLRVSGRLLNRLTGGFLLAAASGLALARKP